MSTRVYVYALGRRVRVRVRADQVFSVAFTVDPSVARALAAELLAEADMATQFGLSLETLSDPAKGGTT